jgi:D-serine deaminase-like pyridoxal phosphate-dependent protein
VTATVDATALAALADEPLDWRYKGLPHRWWGRTSAEVCAAAPDPFADGAVGPLCTLKASALDHNAATMAAWCRDRDVELAPHGKTHMAPQLFAKQAAAGACAVTLATVSQVRTYRAFGANAVILANELVDTSGLRWLAAELDAYPEFDLMCWVDSVRGVELMTAALTDAGADRAVDVCVEVGMTGGRTGCRNAGEVDDVARAAVASDRVRLVGVAGYEAALGHDVSPDARAGVRDYLAELRATVLRLTPLFEAADVVVTAGGSTYFNDVADVLGGDWPAGLAVRTILRSGCYLTHDDGLYRRTSPLAGPGGLRPALSVWAQVCSRPEADLALLTMGRRDVSFDQDLPLPHGLDDSVVVKLNDQHAYLRLGPSDRVAVTVGSWVEFGVSHPCTVFDKWQLIPLLDDAGRVADLIRTFF